ENGLPVLLHVHDCPALSLGLVECLVEPSDVRGTVVGPLALGVGVMHEAHEAQTAAGGCPLQHLVVAVGVAESKQRPPANKFVDVDWLAGFVVDEVDLWQAYEYWLAVAQLELRFASATNDLFGRNAVHFLRPHAHKLHATAGHNVGLEAI